MIFFQFSAKGKPIDATQELLAVGMANVANSLFQGYRANSGLARSAVNNASGVRTPLANLYIGLVVMLALVYLAKYFYYIPLSVLGAIIISAVIFQVQYHVIKPMWRSKRKNKFKNVFLYMSIKLNFLFFLSFRLGFVIEFFGFYGLFSYAFGNWDISGYRREFVIHFISCSQTENNAGNYGSN